MVFLFTDLREKKSNLLVKLNRSQVNIYKHVAIQYDKFHTLDFLIEGYKLKNLNKNQECKSISNTSHKF